MAAIRALHGYVQDLPFNREFLIPMNLNTSYSIEHSWGDPRDSEYCNGIRVGYAHYKEGRCLLTFKLTGENEADSKEIVWTLVAPKNMRDILGSKWNQHRIVLDRVISYLSTAEICDIFDEEARYQNVSVDMSNVPSWVWSKLILAKRKLAPLSSRLPNKKALFLFVVGIVLYYSIQHYYLLLIPGIYVVVFLQALAIATFILLLQEGRKWYEATRMPVALQALANRQSMSNLECLKITFISFWPRATTTIVLIVVLLKLSWMINLQ
jgi:hypothetical protein